MQSSNRQPTNDEVRQVLLIFSSGQSFSIQETARAADLPVNTVWDVIQILAESQLITHRDNKYQITKEGLAYLQRLGIRLSKTTNAGSAGPQPVAVRTEDTQQSFPLFGTVSDGIIWMILPSIILVGIGAMVIQLFSQPLDITDVYLVLGILLLSGILFLYSINSFIRVNEYQSLVIFRLGKCIGAKGPGPILVIPFLDKPQTVELRVRHQEVPHETCITQDNVQIDVDFVFYWKINQPVWSQTRVTDPDESIRLLATALLRAVIAHFPFNEVLNQRERINDLLREKIDEISADWGLYVTTVEIREIKPPDAIVDSMHKQRAAEWQRRATVTEAEGYREAVMKRAEGEAEALKMLYTIANQIDDKTLNLKYFEMLRELGKGESTKYIFPMELTHLVRPIINAVNPEREADSQKDKRSNSTQNPREERKG
jgi:regulator of protease activity HflC (stomatin/prohibitin superfamily)/predicted transcriptional regulator